MKNAVNPVTFFIDVSISEPLCFVLLTSSTIFEVKLSSFSQITSARHFPDITLLPESSVSPQFFRTGSDSPVSTDSFISAEPDIILQSQQTTEPLSRHRTSPFLISSGSISHSSPRRSTRTLGSESSVSFSSCRFAFISWTIPTAVLTAITRIKSIFFHAPTAARAIAQQVEHRAYIIL